MSELTFDNIRGIHENRPCIVMGHGPSLNSHIPHLDAYKNNNVVLIGCNEWYKIYNTEPHYWVLANNVQTVKTDLSIMNKRNIPVLYADSVDYNTPRSWISEYVKCPILLYDERHLDGTPCCELHDKNCKNVIPGRPTIYHEVINTTGLEKFYNTCGTVAIHMIAFAVIMKCNPIYFTGIDMNYALPYANNALQKQSINWLHPFTQDFVKSVQILQEHASTYGGKIYTANDQNTFGTFETRNPL